MTVGCLEPDESGDAQTTPGSTQDGGNATGASDAGSGQPSSGASESSDLDAATGPTDGGAASTSGNDVGIASSGLDAAAAEPDWAGLVTLGGSTTTAPDGAVINRDGGLRRYDPDAAGPVLNPEAQAACLVLANNICNRSADCEISLAQLPASRRQGLVESCLDTFLFTHNCNRAVRTTSAFDACAESVKTRDCGTMFGNDSATACIDEITFQP